MKPKPKEHPHSNRWYYPAEALDNPIHQLAKLADLNGVWATDILVRAQGVYTDGDLWREQFAEAMETAGLDPMDFTMDDAEQADAFNRAKIRRLQEMLEERNRRITERQRANDPDFYPDQPVEAVPDYPIDRPTNTKRKKIWGHPATSVIRWMGKEGWKYAQAKAAVDGLLLDVADGTIRAQLSAGAKGKRGAPADLSADQIRQVQSAAESVTR